MQLLKQFTTLWISIAIFLLHQFTEPFISNRIIDSYLDDVLFFPIAYGVILLLLKQIIHQNFRLNIFMMVSGYLLTVMATEWLFPLLSNLHVSDPYDALAYLIGLVIFHFSLNQMKSEKY